MIPQGFIRAIGSRKEAVEAIEYASTESHGDAAERRAERAKDIQNVGVQRAAEHGYEILLDKAAEVRLQFLTGKIKPDTMLIGMALPRDVATLILMFHRDARLLYSEIRTKRPIYPIYPRFFTTPHSSGWLVVSCYGRMKKIRPK